MPTITRSRTQQAGRQGLTALIVLIVLLVVSVALAASGVMGADRSVAPRCEQVERYDTTRALVAGHPDLVTMIQDAGGTVEVRRGCGDDTTLGVVQIRVAPQQRSQVERVLNNHAGFGVPIDIRNR